MVNDGKYHHNDINDNGLTIRTEENTVDKVFLLSFMEAAQYGDEVYLFRCPVTKCAEDKYYQICSARGPHDVWNSDGWWLRSPGYSFDTAAAVRIDGELYEHGFDTYWYGFVRPAIWIDLNKLVF